MHPTNGESKEAEGAITVAADAPVPEGLTPGSVEFLEAKARAERPRFGPGFINVETENGISHSSTRLMHFRTADEVNAYFEEHKDDGLFQVDREADGMGGLFMWIQKTMTAEQIQDLQDFAYEYEQFKEKRKEQKLKAMAEEEAAKTKAITDSKELQELGKKCRDNHGSVIEENVKLKKELKKLKGGKR